MAMHEGPLSGVLALAVALGGCNATNAPSDALPEGRCGAAGLRIEPASATRNGSVSVPFTLDTRGCTQLSGLQWDLTVTPSDVGSVVFAEGPVAIAGEKMVACNQVSPTTTRCLVIGLTNNTPIASGVVAVATLGITSTAAASAPLTLSQLVATSGGGDAIELVGTNSALTIAP